MEIQKFQPYNNPKNPYQQLSRNHMNNNSALTNANFPTQNSALDITVDHASNQSIIQHTKQSTIPNNSYMRYSKQQKQQIDLSTLNEEIEKVAGKHDNSVLSTQHKLMPTQQYNLNEDLSPSQQKQYVRGTPQDGLLNFKKKFGVTDTNQQPLRYCIFKIDQLKQLGDSLYLYFHQLKILGVFFGLMSLISGFLCYLNFRNDFLNTSTMTTYLDYISLANTYGYRNMTTNVDAYNWHQNNQMWKYLYYYSHFGQTIAIILFLMIFRVYLNRKSKQVLRVASNNYKYCVQVDFTKYNEKYYYIDETDIKNKFKQFGSIQQVSIIRDYGRLLYAFKEVGNYQKLIQMTQYKNRYGNGKLYGDIKKMELQLQNLTHEANKLNTQKYCHEQFPIATAIIRFQYINERTNCIEQFNKNKNQVNTDYDMDPTVGKNQFKIGKPLDASVFNYDQYYNSTHRSVGLSFLLGSFILIILASTYLICFTFREYLKEIEYKPICKDVSYLGKQESDYLSQIDKDQVKECFCSQYSSFDIIYGKYTKYYDYCYAYAKNVKYYYSAMFFLAFGIYSLNMLIDLIVTQSSKMLRFKVATDKAKYVMSAIFLFQFLNTWLPLVLITMNDTDDSNVQTISKNLDFDLPNGRNFNTLVMFGSYRSSTREWIQWINFPICTIIVLQLIFQMMHFGLSILTHKLILKYKQRDLILKSEFHQVNKGIKFRIENYLAFQAAYICTALLFSAAIPGVMMVIPLYLTCIFQIRKSIMLTHYRVPLRYDVSLLQRFVTLILMGMSVSLGLTLWVFSEPLIFPIKVKIFNINATNFFYVDDISLYDRIFTRNGFQYFVILNVLMTILPMSKYINIAINEGFKLFNKKNNKVQSLDGSINNDTVKVNDLEKRTTDETQELNHLTNYVNLISYNAIDHKKYRRAIVLLNKSSSEKQNDGYTQQNNDETVTKF